MHAELVLECRRHHVLGGQTAPGLLVPAADRAMDGLLDVLGEQPGDRAAVDGGELFVAEVESILS